MEEANPGLLTSVPQPDQAGDAVAPTAFITILCVEDSRDEISSCDVWFVRNNMVVKNDLPEDTSNKEDDAQWKRSHFELSHYSRSDLQVLLTSM